MRHRVVWASFAVLRAGLPVIEAHPLVVRRLGLVDYSPTWKRMRQFTEARRSGSVDEFWLLEHPPVFTQGQAGRAEHVLDAGSIPVIEVDRGGQVTYHGPGQLVVYLLIDLKRLGIGVRRFVSGLEGSVIRCLAGYGIEGGVRRGAPGVYVGERKIAALGLRVRKGCTYHGLALNVDVDLAPFGRINPCGFRGLEVTRMTDLCTSVPTVDGVAQALVEQLNNEFGYVVSTDPGAVQGVDRP